MDTEEDRSEDRMKTKPQIVCEVKSLENFS